MDEGFFPFVIFCILAFLSYETPLWIAGLFGERDSFLGWWSGLKSHGDTPTIILVGIAYMVVGFTLWAGPLLYLVTVLRPQGGRALRARTGAVLGIVLFPLQPVWDRAAAYFQDSKDARDELRELRALYRSDYRNQFPTFKLFLDFYRQVNSDEGGHAGAGYAPPPPEPPKGPDPLADAEQLLGLVAGYTATELNGRYRALMRQVHPDIAPPNDIARRVIAARDTICAARGWKK